MLVHERQLLGPIPVLRAKPEIHSGQHIILGQSRRSRWIRHTWGPTGLPPEGSFSKISNLSSLTPGSPGTGLENILGATARARKKEA